MDSAKHGARAMMRLAMVVGIVAALGLRGAVSAFPVVGGAVQPPTTTTAVTQHTLETYWDMLDWGASAAPVLAADAVLTYGDTGQAMRGRAAITRELYTLYHAAFAGRLTIDDRIIGGGWGATAGMFVGTHIGRYAGLPATGNTVSVPYTAFYTVAGGQIATIRLDFSQQALLRQLANPASPWFTTPVRPGLPY